MGIGHVSAPVMPCDYQTNPTRRPAWKSWRGPGRSANCCAHQRLNWFFGRERPSCSRNVLPLYSSRNKPRVAIAGGSVRAYVRGLIDSRKEQDAALNICSTRRLRRKTSLTEWTSTISQSECSRRGSGIKPSRTFLRAFRIETRADC